MTNIEKAEQIALNLFQDGVCYQDYEAQMQEIQSAILKMAEWKDEQHKQELIRIYNFVSLYLTPEANNDLKIIIGIC